MTFIEEWERFLSNINTLVENKPQTEFGFSSGDYADIMVPLNQLLKSEDAISAVESAAGDVDEETIQLLQTELWIFNSKIEEDFENIAQMDSDTISEFVSARSEQADTIKSSVENILPFPKWINRLLKILDEVLNTIPI